MDIRDRRGLKNAAREALDTAAYDPRRLVLIHSGIAAAVLLAVSVISFLLQKQVAASGGLSGLGIRGVLDTVSAVLETAQKLAMPFWALGYTGAVLRIARRQEARPETLTAGFRNLGGAAVLILLKELIFFLPGMVCMYPAMVVFMFLPQADALTAALEPVLAAGGDMTALLENEAVLAAVNEAALPMVLVFLAVYLPVLIFLAYRLRLAEFALMDEPRAGAVAALRKSVRLTRHNCAALFRLDLSYWWYYLISGGIATLCYGDLLLRMFGVELPISGTAAFFLFYVLYLAADIGFSCLAQNPVQTTYALCYDALASHRD